MKTATQTKVDITKIHPNPYQPESRMNVPDEVAEKFGKSILEHGLMQLPVGRRCNGAGAYEMGDGWLRLQGFKWLVNQGHVEYQEIPFDERELTDKQMADMVMEANMIRQDLTAIEQALLYQRYLKDFGISETQLAKNHNMSQGAVANTIRLLQLPDEVKDKITDGSISGTHARQLLRLNKAPEMQKHAMKDCLDRNLSVSALDENIRRLVHNNSGSLDPDTYMVYHRPKFDVTECKGCEFITRAAPVYGQEKAEDRCLDENCWKKKQDKAEKDAEKNMAAKLKKKGGAGKVLTSKQVDYDQRHDLEASDLKMIDNPAECKTCAETAMFVYEHNPGEKPMKICLKPSCFQAKQTKKTRETNKIKKEQDRTLTEKLGEVYRKAPEDPTACMRVIVRHLIPMLSAQGRADICKVFECPSEPNGRMDQELLKAKVNSMDIEQLLELGVAVTITHARRSEWCDYSIKLSDELKRDCAIISHTWKDLIKENAVFEEANCRGCEHVKEKLIGTGEEPCTFIHFKRINEKGKCDGRKVMQTKKEKPPPESRTLAEVFTASEEVAVGEEK